MIRDHTTLALMMQAYSLPVEEREGEGTGSKKGTGGEKKKGRNLDTR